MATFGWILFFHFTQNGYFGQIWVDLSHLFYPIWADFAKFLGLRFYPIWTDFANWGGFGSPVIPNLGRFGQIWVYLGLPFHPKWLFWANLGGLESSVSPNLGRFGQIGCFWFPVLPNLGRFWQIGCFWFFHFT